MVVVLEAVLVSHNLPVKFVYQIINGGIQVLVRTFGKQITALDMNITFGPLSALLLFLFFHGKQHLDIDYLVKVAGYAIQLGRDIASQGGSNFKVVTADRQVHKNSCTLGIETRPTPPNCPLPKTWIRADSLTMPLPKNKGKPSPMTYLNTRIFG